MTVFRKICVVFGGLIISVIVILVASLYVNTISSTIDRVIFNGAKIGEYGPTACVVNIKDCLGVDPNTVVMDKVKIVMKTFSSAGLAIRNRCSAVTTKYCSAYVTPQQSEPSPSCNCDCKDKTVDDPHTEVIGGPEKKDE